MRSVVSCSECAPIPRSFHCPSTRCKIHNLSTAGAYSVILSSYQRHKSTDVKFISTCISRSIVLSKTRCRRNCCRPSADGRWTASAATAMSRICHALRAAKQIEWTDRPAEWAHNPASAMQQPWTLCASRHSSCSMATVQLRILLLATHAVSVRLLHLVENTTERESTCRSLRMIKALAK